MAKRLVTDTFWKHVEPLFPKHATSPQGGRPRVPDRDAFTGIVFVLRSGIPWQMLPLEMGCGSGSTCWRRFQEWTALAIWPRLQRKLLRILGRQGRIRLRRAVIDSASVRAVKGGRHTGPNPTDRGKKGCKRHVITDARGIPLAVQTGPANEPDAKRALPLLDQIPACAGRRGRPRHRPKIFQGDGAYGIAEIIRAVRRRGVIPLLAAYGKSRKSHGSGLGRTRYVAERTLSWFGNFRRIKLCYERWGEHFQGFHDLAACLLIGLALES